MIKIWYLCAHKTNTKQMLWRAHFQTFSKTRHNTQMCIYFTLTVYMNRHKQTTNILYRNGSFWFRTHANFSKPMRTPKFVNEKRKYTIDISTSTAMSLLPVSYEFASFLFSLHFTSRFCIIIISMLLISTRCQFQYFLELAIASYSRFTFISQSLLAAAPQNVFIAQNFRFAVPIEWSALFSHYF